MHYFKFNIPSWSLSTAHLSLEEDGVYFRLVCHYYDTEKPIPLETESVIRRLRLGSHSDTVHRILAEFFVKTEKGFVNQYCERLIEKYHFDAKKNKKNGKSGGRPKQNNNLHKTQIKPTGIPLETDSQPTGNPNHKPITKNQEPLTNVVSAKAQKQPLDYSCWPEMPEPQTLADWIAMRKRIRADVSQTVINQFGKELTIAVSHGLSVDHCLAECITSNWRGFKYSWLKNQEATRENNQRNARPSKSEQNAAIFLEHIDQLERQAEAECNSLAGFIEQEIGNSPRG